ncbi:MAG: hypothetical protein WBN21_11250, partial [Algibacter sp.]
MTKLSTLFALIIALTANSQSLKTLSIEQQLEDVEFIKTELEKLHPGIYTYQTKKEFEDGFISLKENLYENQTVFDFYN